MVAILGYDSYIYPIMLDFMRFTWRAFDPDAGGMDLRRQGYVAAHQGCSSWSNSFSREPLLSLFTSHNVLYAWQK
jgi:hypothetical protein